MHIATVKSLGLGAVVEEEAVICTAAEIEAAHGEDEFRVGPIKVDEVGRAAIGGVGVGGVADDGGGVDAVAGRGGGPLGVGKIVLVSGEDGAAGAGYRGEVRGGGIGPGSAIVDAGVGATAPSPAGTGGAEDAFQSAATSQRHGILRGMKRGKENIRASSEGEGKRKFLGFVDLAKG